MGDARSGGLSRLSASALRMPKTVDAETFVWQCRKPGVNLERVNAAPEGTALPEMDFRSPPLTLKSGDRTAAEVKDFVGSVNMILF